MFDLRLFREIAQKGVQFGAGDGEIKAIFKALAAVTEKELGEFEEVFPRPKPDKEAQEREKVRVEDGKEAEKEIAKEKKKAPHLHVRGGDGTVKPAPEEK